MADEHTSAPPARPAHASTPTTKRAAAFLVWYLRVVTFINFLSAVWVSLGQDLQRHNTDNYFTPYLLTAGFASGVFTWFLAITMRRRKRAAWILNLVLSGLFLVLFVVVMFFPEVRRYAQNWISLVLTAAFVVALLLGRREFYAKGDRSNAKLAAAVGIGGLLVTSLFATFLVTVTNQAHNGHHSTFLERWRYGTLRLISVATDESRYPGITSPNWVNVAINILSTLLLLAVAYAAFRSRKAVDPITPDDEARLRALLDKEGDRDSLGYFALRREKSVVWSPTGKAAVAYRVVGGVSLASGDPIGDPEAWPGAIAPWLMEAREHGWSPAVMGASEEAGTIYARHGLDALELGDEAIVEIPEFTLEGRAMRTVRQAYNRVKRAGYEVRIRRHEDIPAEEMTYLLQRADDWRDGATERGFSMALGRLGDPADGRCVMLECSDGKGELKAVLSFVPWGPEGLSLDLMRRDRDSENGLMEFMVIELLQRAAEIGITQVSLNFAMFRSVFERGSRLGAGPVLRLWRSLLSFFSRWWQIESLYRANAKYRPIWEPRFLLFEKSADLPRIGLASARAEGFLEAPGLPNWMHRRHLEPRP
ncbi:MULTISPECIES: phosphatidylglycerol lysyltransferase domain-containing protein [unclassified Streptomyces]|uniref:phosphatidylglycerol lysyltransferase domain-containing protein n=1 Tax=unclassified Streptomyces TaxID=2593676 RepID=UPI00224E5074|nr:MULTISPECIES: phosphatidylglycerol lysyltransferase domain-containing protein [unclassified Streptomyces]MCX5436877.1 phosphatidylglycerol lysyltransferase domain-containing protein [Streptomyces sp. NBC_00063]WSE14613.1 phosphatidylglycerol lysyltransferase domain-containing protein [Streptomyces sp. NBC_01397]WUB96471.1 phosphatidylglycerol lysyltransferase domain-containing protein [Streptomyces sp. NBC_00569]